MRRQRVERHPVPRLPPCYGPSAGPLAVPRPFTAGCLRLPPAVA